MDGFEALRHRARAMKDGGRAFVCRGARGTSTLRSGRGSVGGAAVAGFAMLSAACSGGSGLGPDVVPEGQAIPVAHVDIEYSRAAGFESSQAIAHFVFSHEGRSARDAAPLSAIVSGARANVPEPGRCQDLTDSNLGIAPPVELLEAGGVTIHTSTVRPAPELNAQGGDEPAGDAASESVSPALETEHALDEATHSDLANSAATAGDVESEDIPVTISLAPRAFPGVSTLAAGVMYTSRDREIPLPASTEYRVEIEGSTQVPAMSLVGRAPAYLDHVTVGGTPIEQLAQLDVGSPIDVTWDIGAADDLVVVDVTNPQDGQAVLRCSYSDAAGAGTVPWVRPLEELEAASSQVGLRVHRLRVVETSASGSGVGAGARGELRFDFELTRDVALRSPQ